MTSPGETTAGLCRLCRHRRIVTSKRGSEFLYCRRSEVDSAFPRYPHLPVLRCEGFVGTPDEDAPC
jgi:hypothetical protein